MVFGFGNSQQTAWGKVDASVEELLIAARALHKTVEPDPSDLGILGAGSIGARAESVRQAINKLNKAMAACAAAESDGKMQEYQIESVLHRIEINSPLLIGVLERMGTVHFHRFRELGMGLPTIVKAALTWIESSTKACCTTLERVNKSPELVQRISLINNRLLDAASEALEVYSGTES
ncbi:hypothetical protein Plec18167_005823 [Paecilomyces lecythidis]|uniref:Uncharacterized protein n=1 Tax=Paecilomyces lecythidis TaxID=3004212 RepID=A0ABR3XF86_9EURO